MRGIEERTGGGATMINVREKRLNVCLNSGEETTEAYVCLIWGKLPGSVAEIYNYT